MPAAFARRTMSAVPFPPGNATTKLGLCLSSISLLRIGPAALPCRRQSAGTTTTSIAIRRAHSAAYESAPLAAPCTIFAGHHRRARRSLIAPLNMAQFEKSRPPQISHVCPLTGATAATIVMLRSSFTADQRHPTKGGDDLLVGLTLSLVR